MKKTRQPLPSEPRSGHSRRSFLKGALAAAAGAAVGPYVWIKSARAAQQTAAFGTIKHLLYIRLAGGFRFPTAFNADVSAEFNPFGAAASRAEGAQWGVGALLGQAPYLDGEGGAALRALGMRSVPELADQVTVIGTVDHEPLAGSADGNHITGLERFYTGYVGGTTGLFTMINYGLRHRQSEAAAEGRVVLPAFVLGGSGMGRGIGAYAAHRPPVLSGTGFDRFGFDADRPLPAWADAMTDRFDQRMKARQHLALQPQVDAYIETRKATKAYSEIFASDALKVRNRSTEPFDGLSNQQLEAVFGDSGSARNVRLALRLFHFGCPAIYLDQGGYDYHSGEENGLPGRLVELNRLLSGLELALKTLDHPDGGKYWDHTVVALGSEFSRTARGNRFNSARGSDHGGDLATRWMSMPFMGGAVARPGALLGATRASDLQATGKVYSYRSVLKTLMDGLGCQFAEGEAFFPADAPFPDLFVG